MREYQRSFGKSYMIVTREEKDWGFELHMIKNNRIPGVLPLQTAVTDGNLQFRYDITGKSSADIYIKNHRAGGEFLLKVMEALEVVCQGLEEYLLYEDGICLEPESIFISNSDEKIYFCYQPFEKIGIEQGLMGFMEFFLQRMEHTNQEAVRTCYSIYDRCAAGCFRLEELLQKFYVDENGCAISEKVVNRQDKNDGNQKVAHIEMTSSDKGKKGESYSEKNFLEKNILKFVGKLEGFKSPKIKSGSKKTDREKWKKKEKDVIVFESMEEPVFVQNQNPTVFLGSEIDEVLGRLKYEGEGQGSNFYIDKTPYMIGSRKEDVDGFLQSVTASRFHARITTEGSNYYLEDMNSTNGTYLNEKLLSYREKVQLNKNDVIHFAEILYRFV